MRKLTLPFLFILVALFSCTPKGKFSGTLTFTWEDNRSRKEDEIVIVQRLKKIGIEKYTIDIIDNKTIQVEVKNVKDTLRFMELMNYNYQLEFWETYENPEVYPLLNDLDTRLGAGVVISDSIHRFGIKKDSADRAEAMLMHPLWFYLQLAVHTEGDQQVYLSPGPVAGRTLAKDTAGVNSKLKIGYGLNFPKDLVLRWTLLPAQDSLFELVALKKYPGTTGAFMNQSMIIEGHMEKFDGRETLTIKFDEEGTKLWEKMTKKNIGKSIAITLDGMVVNYPNVESAITGGVASISGPDPEQLKIIQQGIQMFPFKTRPVSIMHRFETKK